MVKPGMTQDELDAAVQAYYDDFSKKNPEWVNAEVQEFTRKHELELSQQSNGLQADPAPEKVSVKIFALAVDFGAVNETLNFDVPNAAGTACEPYTTTMTGPRVGEIPHPGPLDNNTVWYAPEQISNPDFYQNLIFGYQGVGRVRTDLLDPNDGQPGINLTGYTVQDYYDNFAGVGNVALEGLVEGWVTILTAKVGTALPTVWAAK